MKAKPNKNTQEYETLKQFHKFSAIKYSLKGSTYLFAVVPFFAELGVNYQAWFGNESTAPSIGMGFGMLIASTVLTILAVVKKDEEFMKKFSPLFYIAVIFLAWAAAFMFLSSIMSEMGKMLMYAACGILAGAISDESEETLVEPKYRLYKELAHNSGLTNSGAFEKHAREQAEKDRQAKERDEAVRNHEPID